MVLNITFHDVVVVHVIVRKLVIIVWLLNRDGFDVLDRVVKTFLVTRAYNIVIAAGPINEVTRVKGSILLLLVSELRHLI